jgi:signal transduction histidine kinase
MERKNRSAKRSAVPLLRAGFAALILLFVASGVVGVRELYRSQEAGQVVIDELRSVELVSSLMQDVLAKEMLINAHIFAQEPTEMSRFEQSLTKLDADYAEAMHEYDGLAKLDDEPAAWRRFRSEVASLDGPIAAVLSASRENRDVEANREMRTLEAKFADVDAGGAELVRINHRHAQSATERMHDRQRAAIVVLVLCTATGSVIAFIVALWLSRIVSTEVRTMTAELEQRNRELDAFAGRVAHDLRGPLTATKLAADLLARRMGSGDRTVSNLERGMTRMETLIRDLLALTRAGTAGNERCDPLAVARSVEEELAAQVHREGGEINVTVQPATVRCSEGLLHQACTNLVENALNYRRADVPVDVSIDGRVIDHVYELHVRDNGRGMADDDARHAFEPFFRSDSARDRPGTGLGLSIVKRVVEASGGDVAIESAINRGTDVILHIPLA